MLNRRSIIISLALLALLVVCLTYRQLLASAFASNPYPHSPESVARGKQIYERHCLTCHGPGGRGDGPAAAAFSTRMDDLSTLPGAPIFPDGVVVYRIANGKDSMPGWRDVLNENELWDVLNYIRSLRRSDR